jgi:hypothetical protein
VLQRRHRLVGQFSGGLRNACCIVLLGDGVDWWGSFWDEAEEFMKYYSWWDGSWDVELTQDGEVTSLVMEISKPEANVHLVSGFGVGLWGYDGKRKKWIGRGFEVDGSFFTTVLKEHPGAVVKPGDVQYATTTSKRTDGSIVKAEETWTYVDENTATIVGKMTTEEGEESSFEYTCKRRESDGLKKLEVSPAVK